MKYTHATLLLEETGAEINEQNLSAVLAAADAEFTTSRVKALVAALEGVDVSTYAADPPEDDVDTAATAADGEPHTSADTAPDGDTDGDVEADVDPDTTATAGGVSGVSPDESHRDEHRQDE